MRYPGLISPALDVAHPLLVIQIPLHGFADPGFKGLLRLPGQLGAHLAGINGITPIVTRAIRHIADLLAIGADLRHHLIEQIADGVHDLQILFFVMTTDVVGLTDSASGDHGVERTGVIFHIEPIADLVTLAIDRQRLAFQGIEDHQRDQLLGEVIRAIVVGAIGHHGRQAISTAPSAYQMIARCLGGRVGTAGGIGGGFGEQRQWLTGSHLIRMGEVTVHLVGGDMVEAEDGLARLI